MRCGEVEANTCSRLDILVTMELGSVVGGNGFDVVAVGVNDRYHALVQGFLGPVFGYLGSE